MIVGVECQLPVSRAERAHVARRLRLALEPFQPRVVRATLHVRPGGGAGADRKILVQASVPLGPAGVVRVEARGVGVRSCAEVAILRVAEAVARRLGAERRELLEFLFLASGAARGWPAAPRGAAPRGRRTRTSPSRRASGTAEGPGGRRARAAA